MFEMIFRRKWEAAHRFIEEENRTTLCTQPHGHTWRVEVRLVSPTPRLMDGKSNTVELFHTVKEKWHSFIDQTLDHAFMVNHHDSLLPVLRKENPNGRFVVTPGDPTTEMLAALFKSKLDAVLASTGKNLVCSDLTIHETETNSIRFLGNPKEVLPLISNLKNPWWTRADLTGHDLETTSEGYIYEKSVP